MTTYEKNTQPHREEDYAGGWISVGNRRKDAAARRDEERQQREISAAPKESHDEFYARFAHALKMHTERVRSGICSDFGGFFDIGGVRVIFTKEWDSHESGIAPLTTVFYCGYDKNNFKRVSIRHKVRGLRTHFVKYLYEANFPVDIAGATLVAVDSDGTPDRICRLPRARNDKTENYEYGTAEAAWSYPPLDEMTDTVKDIAFPPSSAYKKLSYSDVF